MFYHFNPIKTGWGYFSSSDRTYIRWQHPVLIGLTDIQLDALLTCALIGVSGACQRENHEDPAEHMGKVGGLVSAYFL